MGEQQLHTLCCCSMLLPGAQQGILNHPGTIRGRAVKVGCDSVAEEGIARTHPPSVQVVTGQAGTGLRRSGQRAAPSMRQ